MLAIASVVALTLALFYAGPSNVLHGLASLDIYGVSLITSMLFLNFLIVTARLGVLLRGFDRCLHWSDAYRATAAGLLVGLLPLQIVGQLLGRQALLRQTRITPAANTATMLVERLVVLATSASFGLTGALYLLEMRASFDVIAGIPWLEAVIGASVALVLGAYRTTGPNERVFLRSFATVRNLPRFVAVTVLTAVGQLVVIGTFVAGLYSVAPELKLSTMLAASAVVSFAAGIPISINGWGVRELAAVYVFNLIGVGASDALTISIALGLCGTVVVILAALPLIYQSWSMAGPSSRAGRNLRQSAAVAAVDPTVLTRNIVWLLSAGLSALVFFQFQIPVFG